LAKARVLALGYGAGWRKFNAMAYLPAYLGKTAQEVFSAPVNEYQIAAFTDFFHKYEKDKPTLKKWETRTKELETEWVNSWLIVQDFRNKNPRIVQMWRQLDQWIHQHVGTDITVDLKSGRCLQYREIAVNEKDGVTATICKGGKLIRQKLYGGLLTENVVSAVARDILRDAAIRLSQSGYRIIMRVHDELVMEVPEEADISPIRALMAKNPHWIPDCPIDVSVEESKRYKK
jgi:DNA polymerase